MSRPYEGSLQHRSRLYVEQRGAAELSDVVRDVGGEPSVVRVALLREVRAGRLGYPFRGLYTTLAVGESMGKIVDEHRRQEIQNVTPDHPTPCSPRDIADLPPPGEEEICWLMQSPDDEARTTITVGDTFDVNGTEFEVVDEHDGLYSLLPMGDPLGTDVVMTAEQLAACKRTRVL